MQSRATVTDREVEAYYESRSEQFEQPEQVCARPHPVEGQGLAGDRGASGGGGAQARPGRPGPDQGRRGLRRGGGQGLRGQGLRHEGRRPRVLRAGTMVPRVRRGGLRPPAGAGLRPGQDRLRLPRHPGGVQAGRDHTPPRRGAGKGSGRTSSPRRCAGSRRGEGHRDLGLPAQGVRPGRRGPRAGPDGPEERAPAPRGRGGAPDLAGPPGPRLRDEARRGGAGAVPGGGRLRVRRPGRGAGAARPGAEGGPGPGEGGPPAAEGPGVGAVPRDGAQGAGGEGRPREGGRRGWGWCARRPRAWCPAGRPFGDLGSAAALDEAAFDLAPNAVSEPVRLPRGYAVLRVLEKKPFDAAAFAKEKESLRRPSRKSAGTRCSGRTWSRPASASRWRSAPTSFARGQLTG